MDSQEMYTRIGQLFDLLSSDYDNVGVDFFGPIAEALITGIGPDRGSRVADLGCGTGALTTRLAAAVGASGHVTGVDLSAQMIERARSAVADRGLDNVSFMVGNVARPNLAADGFDLVTASLVIFFLPDPDTALHRWVELLRPGGVVAVTTFGDAHPGWDAAESELDPWMPGRVPGKDAAPDRFGSSEAMEAMFATAGAEAVTCTRHRLAVRFDSFDQHIRWSRSVGLRAAWDLMPAERRPGVIAAMRDHLAPATDASGRIDVWQEILVTTGRRPG